MAYKLSWSKFGEDCESFRYTILGIAFLLLKIFKTGVSTISNVNLSKLL